VKELNYKKQQRGAEERQRNCRGKKKEIGWNKDKRKKQNI